MHHWRSGPHFVVPVRKNDASGGPVPSSCILVISIENSEVLKMIDDMTALLKAEQVDDDNKKVIEYLLSHTP